VKRSTTLIALFLVLMAAAASAQESRADVSANLSGVFGDSVTGNGLTQSPTKSAGALFSLRYYLNRYAGVEANYGYTRNSQNYTSGFGDQASVQAGMHEVTGAFLLRGGIRGPIQPFALAGGGILVFNPATDALSSSTLSLSRQTRPTFLYGAGADVKLNRVAALRVQYRGLLYQAPDFHDAADLHTGSVMHTAEPTVGLVFKF
jgi:opacity protein-like surface antigen